MGTQTKMNRERFLPHFPRTPHLPWKPNASKDDVVAQDAEASVVFDHTIVIEEKIDGASVGFSVVDKHPVIRNREHFLNKGFVGRTPAKKQFASIHNYYYQHSKRFEALSHLGPFSVYGEWMWMQHGIHYDRLPDWFIAYDIWNWQVCDWLAPDSSRRILEKCGFHVPRMIYRGAVEEFQQLEEFTQEQSEWSDTQVEGIYLRVSANSEVVTHRFKMVREDFVAGALWQKDEVKKNSLK